MNAIGLQNPGIDVFISRDIPFLKKYDTKIIVNVCDLCADSFTEEEPTQKEEISMTVYLDNEYFPEVQIEFYRYDGNDCLAVVDGEAVSLVERSYVVDFVEAVNAIVLN